MHIDWAAFATVFAVSVGITVALVGVFTLGIAALSRKARRQAAAVNGPAVNGASAAVAARTGAYACFAACAAAVAYGIFVIVS